MRKRKDIYETNFDRAVKLGVWAEEGLPDYRRSESSGYMDLVVERQCHMDQRNGLAFSLSHYYKQNGDLCSDPDMVILIYPSLKMVEALTYQTSIPPKYEEVYPEPGKVYPKVKKALNAFLRTWLNNLIEQKHGKNWIAEAE